MQYIVNWLAEPPRGVAITRQAVHAWVKARIKKLERLKAAFADTGLEGPFQDRNAVGMTQSAEAITHVKRLSTPMLGPMRAAIRSDHAPTKRVDVEEFMVDESDFERGRNPLLPKL